MKIIGAGFGRTGTTSTRLALEQLGFGPCHHMMSVVENPQEAEAWIQAFDGEPSDWDTLLGKYMSTMDWPATAFWKELVEFYPDSRVILNLRSPDEWLNSFAATLRPIWRAALNSEFDRFPDRLEPYLRLAGSLAGSEFDGNLDDSEHLIAMYNEHNAEVRELVPDDRLLVFEPSSGWGPLCDFLGVARPAGMEFPHVNDSASFAKMVDQLTAFDNSLAATESA